MLIHTGLYVIDFGWPAILVVIIMMIGIICTDPNKSKPQPPKPKQQAKKATIQPDNVIPNRRYNF